MTTTEITLTDELTALIPDAVRPGTAEPAGFQLGVVHRPDVVVAARDARDVAITVRAAADRGMPVTVVSTGHGTRDGADGGVLLDTSGMDRVEIDASGPVARVGAGVRWGAVVEAAEPYGLRPPSGSFAGVGCIGYVFGGGIGLAARSDGWAADHVRAFELVSADPGSDAGAVREVTAASDPATFARLRGTGPLPGEVVTAMTIGLLPSGPITAGALVYDLGPVGEPGDDSADASPLDRRGSEPLHAFHAWTRDLPEHVTAGLSVVPYPDLPFLPEALRGRRVARVAVVVLGDEAAADRVLAPLRAAVPPIEDTVAPMRPTEGHRVYSEPSEPHAYTGENVLLDDLSPEGLDAVAALDGPMTVVGIRVLGGATARPATVPDTVRGRGAGYLVHALAPMDADLAATDPGAAVAAADPSRVLRAFGAGSSGSGPSGGSSRAFGYGPRPSAGPGLSVGG